MPDITLTTGADTSGATRGLAELRNEVTSAGAEIKSSFASAFSLTNIAALASVEGLRQLVDKAHEIHHEADRFGIDAQELQTIANAAQQNGVSLEQVAQVMNRLSIVTEKQFGAIEALGISTDYFLKLDAAGRFYAIADAMQKNGVNTETYTAAVTLLGRRAGGELVPVLAQGRQAIEDLGKSMAIMSERQIADLDRLYRAWQQLKSVFITVGAFLAEGIEEPIEKGLRRVAAMFDGLGNQMIHDGKAVALALTGQFAAAWEEHKKGLEIANQIHDAEVKAEQAIDNAGQSAIKTSQDVVEGMEGIAGAAGSAASGVKTVAAATEDLAAIEERNRVAALDNEGKLQDLLAQRQGLMEQLTTYGERGLLSDQQELELKTQIATVDGQIGELQRQKATDEDAYNQKLADELDATEKQTEAISEQNDEQVQIAAGHSEIAARMRDEFAIAQQIEDVTERINQAWSEGNQTLAEQLQDLKDQLETEKNLTKAADDRAAAERRRAEAQPRGQALLGALGAGVTGLGFQDTALGLALNPVTGAVDPQRLAQLRASAQLDFIAGRNPTFLQTAQANRNFTDWGNRQTADALRLQAEQQREMIQILQEIAAGQIPPPG